MNRRKALAAAAIAATSQPIQAGGMAVIHLVGQLPVARAGTPFRLRFAMLGHDISTHLWRGPQAIVTFIPKYGRDAIDFVVPGKGGDMTQPGIFETEITLPEVGDYKWCIQASSYEPTYFPTLQVLDPQKDETEDSSTVTITRAGFIPAQVNVTPGEKVRWVNTDTHSSHQITWQDLQMDDSAPLLVGAEFTHTFDTPGEYEYFCGPHAHKTGIVIVSES